ncbi:uncharacterized protein LOC128239007 [Mya arenaria]|uniref:uncharacterized protein LOC128238656 n=1 Tax=Mya arenaria TaxID=6604 RepID=UPI0022E17048|nr:uncharacterized protein LOC128238656 [Mya arenaria]XP_052811374.1 uncharacterized protein LOC128239007 [Mya arenaria]
MIFYILLISTLIGANSAKRYPARKCVFSYEDAWTYGRVNPGHQWICSEDQYAETTYPTATIDALLTKYAHYKAELEITRSCVDFVDYNADSLEGYGTYYNWTSMCKLVRTPIKMVWAKPDGLLTPELAAINGGFLPCFVLEGQFLYNAECVHPFYGTDTSSNSGVARLLAATTWTPVTKKSCYQSYFYIPGYICKPSGFVTRRVLVYSPHLDLIFKTEITDIPTSCICAKCDC